MRVERHIEGQKAGDHYQAITQRFMSDLYDCGLLEVPAAVPGKSDAEQFDDEVAAATVKFTAFHRLASARSILEIPVRSCALTHAEARELAVLALRIRGGLVLADEPAVQQVVLYRLLMERAKQLA